MIFMACIENRAGFGGVSETRTKKLRKHNASIAGDVSKFCMDLGLRSYQGYLYDDTPGLTSCKLWSSA